ncbi:HNH endonuclease signature motif containing protein [Micromonospora purpureochromogenes]|uniref:HNH endonuclease signature motif containing protein n=1 Tax=Micromonospora purpureochromogenes TaxID=47872 RepID=UPI0033D41FA4
MERVAKMPASEGGCWVWTGATTDQGYGAIRNRGKVEYVHRLMAAEYGMKIDGETVDHLCFNRACVRLSHLMVCTRSENARREMSDGWRAAVAELMDEMNGERAK